MILRTNHTKGTGQDRVPDAVHRNIFYFKCRRTSRMSFLPAISIGLAALVSVGNSLAVCREIKVMMSKPAYSEKSIETLAVETSADPLVGNVYVNLDIDFDGQSDDVHGSCSPSSEPADGCLLSYRLTKSNKIFSHEFSSDESFF
jgi:hypothetical protein